MNQRWLLIIVSFLAIFSLSASGWLFYQNLQLQKQISQLSNQPSPSPTPLVSPKPSAEAETADWKTYTNPDFSFKYPNDWQLDDTGGEGGAAIIIAPQPDRGNGTRVIMSSLTGMPFDSKWDAYLSTSNFELISSNQTKIDGHNFLKMRVKPRDLSNSEVYRIAIDISNSNSQPANNSWIIYANYAVGQENESIDQFVSIIDQILSTFQFTD
ncbi:MAG: PsbP-related protein [Patescibacteria group bacterium]|nr:PsbP-related protein [Patescibacteria group bacterium]